MNLRGSPAVGVIAGIVILVGAVVAMRGCGKSPSSALRETRVWQHCLACGHEWRMNAKKRLNERRRDPTGNRFTRCPKCGKWRGVTMGYCSECGKHIPNVMMHVAEDGTITTSERTLCDECAKKHRAQPVDEREEAFEGE